MDTRLCAASTYLVLLSAISSASFPYRCSLSFYGLMNDVVACPRGDRCNYCRSFVFIPKNSISGLVPCLDCWYIKVALWIMRSVPFTQLRKTLTIPDLLLYEVASFLV